MKILLTLALLTVAVSTQAQDDSAFLACARIQDRDARLLCLDEALNSAVGEQEEAQATDEVRVENFGNAQAVSDSRAEEDVHEEKRSFFRLPKIGNIFKRDDSQDDQDIESDDSDEVAESDRKPNDRVDGFGRETRVVSNEKGEDELHDTVTELLEAKPNQWLIKLASGQVWRQTHPKRFNLKVGDTVRIYPSHWGDDYRLQTDKRKGFIQIARVE